MPAAKITNLQKAENSAMEEELSRQLRDLKITPTAQRIAVLHTLLKIDEGIEFTCTDMYKAILAEKYYIVPISACYRALGVFERSGIIHQRYRYCHGRPISSYSRSTMPKPSAKAHFVCIRCLKKTPISDQLFLSEIDTLAENMGIKLISGTNIDGLCPACT